jgi:hypothetical protein
MMKIQPLQSLHTSNSVVTDSETNIPSVPFYINNDTMPTVVSFSFIESTGKLLPGIADRNADPNDPASVNDELAIANNSPAIRKPMITNDDMAL